MDLFKDITLPLSLEHIKLLHILLIMMQAIYILFISLMIGGMIISYFSSRKYSKTKDENEFYLIKNILERIILNKSSLIIFGLVSLITIILIYIQILQTGNIDLSGFYFVSFIFLLTGLIAVYTYKYSFKLLSLFNKLPENENKKGDEELSIFSQQNLKANKKSLIIGIISLLISLYYYSSMIVITNSFLFAENQHNLFSILFCGKVWIKFIHFISLGFLSITIFIFYDHFVNQKERSEAYEKFLLKKLLPVSLVSVLVQPFFILINLYLLPKVSLGEMQIYVSILAVVLVFGIVHLIYSLFSELRINHIIYTFYLLFLFIIALNIIDVETFSINTQKSNLAIEQKYIETENILKAKLGINTVKVSGEDIFNGKCSACHKFDAKLIGPPYNEVLPKYANNKSKLVAFVLNPQRVNTAYPPMPAQGLKPIEAEAVVDYILNKANVK